MKREDVLKIFTSATDEQITNLLNIHGEEMQSSKDALKEAQEKLGVAETKAKGFEEQLKQRDRDIKELQTKVSDNADLTKQLTDLQTKYNTDTAKLQADIESGKRDRASEKLFDGYEFSSDYAKKAIMAEFAEQKFTLDEKTGEFLGGKDWLEKLKTASPTAFKAAETDPDPNADGDNGGSAGPRFASNTNGGKTPKTMSLTDLMAAKNANPNLQIDFSSVFGK